MIQQLLRSIFHITLQLYSIEIESNFFSQMLPRIFFFYIKIYVDKKFSFDLGHRPYL